MGFYAGLVSLKHRYSTDASFWENARRYHRKIKPLVTNRGLFSDFLNWCELDPTIIEAISFKKLGTLVPEHSGRYQKLSAFGQRDDVVLSILKRDRMESLDTITMGTAITNLTRLDFPTTFGPLQLDRLIMKAGGGFPLANFSLLLGAVTCGGKLSLVIEFVEQSIDVPTMAAIKDKALDLLFDQ
jgi:hypothetical protein